MRSAVFGWNNKAWTYQRCFDICMVSFTAFSYRSSYL